MFLDSRRPWGTRDFVIPTEREGPGGRVVRICQFLCATPSPRSFPLGRDDNRLFSRAQQLPTENPEDPEFRTQNAERRKEPLLNSAFCILRSEFTRVISRNIMRLNSGAPRRPPKRRNELVSDWRPNRWGYGAKYPRIVRAVSFGLASWTLIF